MPTTPSRRPAGRAMPRYLSAALCLTLCAALFLAVYLLAGDRKADTADAPVPTAEPTATLPPTAEPSPTPVPWLLEETADAGQEYIDKLCFLGDSITYHMASNDFLSFTQVWVPEIGTLALFSCPTALINYYPKDDPDNPRELTIAETAAASQPEYLVITLGINGVAILDEDEFKRYYRDLVDSILENSPDTKIICQSIFPVVESLTPEGITNENINHGNEWIKDVVREKGLRYLNTYEVLVDGSGGLIPEYSPWDGYHVTNEAYEVIFQYIRTHAWQ